MRPSSRTLGRRPVLGSLGTLLTSCAVPGLSAGTASRLIYGSGGAIIEAAPDGSGRVVRVQPPVGGVARDPVWSPDRSRVAYAYTPPIVATRGASPEAMLPVTDLYLLDVASGATRILHAHETPGESLERPMWTHDGAAVLTSVLAPVFEGGAVREVRESVARIMVNEAGGVRAILATGVQDVAVSPDGTRVAWIRRVPEGRVVEVVRSDGTSGVVVVAPEAVDGAAWPRFSPDGRRLVFSAVSPFTPVPTVTPLPRRAAGWVDAAEAAVERHGLPMDLFAVGTDGTGLTRLTTVGEDSPQATWSPDGKRIAIVSGGGTYVLPVGTVELQLVDPEGGHGAIDWR